MNQVAANNGWNKQVGVNLCPWNAEDLEFLVGVSCLTSGCCVFMRNVYDKDSG